MKRFFLFLCATAVCMATAVQAQQRKADKETAQWRYELQAAVGQAAQGSAMVRVWTYSSKPTIAEGQAGKNAVHGIIFKGYPNSTDGTRIIGREPLINDPAVEDANVEYFNNFFKTGGAYQRYVSYIGNGVPDQQIKVGKEWKVGITVIVLVDQLRKRLEEDGIIKELGVEGKLPTLMVVPSAQWCNKNGYMQTFDNQGQTESVPDYQKALLNSSELSQAINAINARMANRGFPLKDLEATLKTLKSESAEDAMLTSKAGAAITESPIDILRRTAKADIWIEIDWNTTTIKGGSQKTLTFSMNALDAYTDMSVAGVSPSTSPAEYTSNFQMPLMIEAAVQGQFDPFCSSLKSYFDRLAKQGRAIKLRVLTWDDFDEDGLMAEFDGDELHDIIEDWVAANTVNGKFGSPDLSPSGNRMTIEQVCIPLQNEKGRELDARSWARNLQKHLKNNYSIESNLSTKGLGQAQLIIGGK